MEFTLDYRGPLKANGSVADKQAIRRRIHGQMRTLWQQVPLSALRSPHGFNVLVEQPSSPDSGSLIQRVGNFRMAPLVSTALSLVAELSIALLRPEAPGAIITQGGEIDNRLKTLLDALRMPKVINELPPGDQPAVDEDPFFCLLEDDNLVTRLSVNTDRLLSDVESPSEVQLLIHVQIQRTKGTMINLVLG